MAEEFLPGVLREFRRQKDLADRAIAQLDDQQLYLALDPESNSVALLMKHLAGNLRSRWSNFLTTDGEKPDRNRDGEFESGDGDSRASLQERWEKGWSILIASVSSLAPADLERKVAIRGETFTVLQAVQRGLTHAAYHAGQIVFLSKHLAGRKWNTLSIPRGGSGPAPGNYLKG